ncbi:hypothetical protein CEXT_208871 [Caerostris extrusa]|uniref:Uncharacterized protein n=1 Tax=Caerostris extrusa TaxID=172846 RepID=A0AAV4MW89_CAEEX|nr:hypothetical protein CEXT_208871 [Caerostris extrusa]
MANDRERKAQEREKLKNIIDQWNANRLDIFWLSEPNEDACVLTSLFAGLFCAAAVALCCILAKKKTLGEREREKSLGIFQRNESRVVDHL